MRQVLARALAGAVTVSALGFGVSGCSSDDSCACQYPADRPSEDPSTDR